MWTAAATLFAASLFPPESLALSVSAGVTSGAKANAAHGARAAEGATSMAAASAAKMTLHRPSSSGFVEPMRFDQKLLICNAYPSTSPATVLKNGKEVFPSDGEAAIKYQQCEYVSIQVQKHDRLDFGLHNMEVEGSFEVGDLPSSDAVLLLVLERHSTSSMISFQSFAFPKSADARDAQLAVINAFSGNSSEPHLRMEDHVSGKELKTVAKRIEQLNFNRVYSVEAGDYDASIMGGSSDEKGLDKKARSLVRMAKSGNYVVLRTGGGEFHESLVVFPKPQPILRSGSQRFASVACGLILAIIASAFAM